MSPVFAYFLLTNIRDISFTQIVDRTAQCMPPSNAKKYPKTWLNLLHSFIVLYKLR